MKRSHGGGRLTRLPILEKTESFNALECIKWLGVHKWYIGPFSFNQIAQIATVMR